MTTEIRNLLKEARKILRAHARGFAKDWDERATRALAAPPAKQKEQEDGCPICGSDVHDRDALDKAEREIERLTALVTQLAPVQGNPKDHYNAGWRDVPVEKEQA